MKIKIILSTNRPGKASNKIGNWTKRELEALDNNNVYEVIDLSEIDLPFFDEKNSPREKQYEHEHTKKWSKSIDEADGIIIVLAEYNGGYPAPIKNAIDYLYWEWVDKPVGFVSYGGSGGKSSFRQLSEILSKMKMKVLENNVFLSKPWYAFYENGEVINEYVQGSFSALMKEMERKYK